MTQDLAVSIVTVGASFLCEPIVTNANVLAKCIFTLVLFSELTRSSARWRVSG